MSSTHSVLRGRQVTRQQIVEILDDMDAGLFKPADYGYGPARRWFIRHNGKSYPSKAVLGIACRMHASEFFGGVAETTRVLSALGFELRCADMKNLPPAELVEISKQIREVAEHVVEEPWKLEPAPAAYYASGSNRPAEIRGLGWAGADIGVVAGELSENALVELEALAGTDVAVFVDSGAFSEVDRDLRVVKPIKHDQWCDILRVYERLSKALGSQLTVVAPDRVGSQGETLSRLRVYAERLYHIAKNGARVLVPQQRGELSLVDFSLEVDRVLAGYVPQWIPAMPCKKGATTPAAVAEFVKIRCPKHVHLLGVGIRNELAADYAAAFAGTETSYSMDSCWIAGKTGNDGPWRKLTVARNAARDLGCSMILSTVAMFTCFGGAL